MKTKRRTINALRIACSMLLVGSLVLFAEDAHAKRRHQRATASPSPPPQSQDSGMVDVSGAEEESVSVLSPAAVSVPATISRKADVGGKPVGLEPGGLERKPSTALVPRSSALLAGIEVSFKLDPRFSKGLYAGESWVSAPISLHGGIQAETAPTVDARVQVVDATGQPVDSSLEWTPADPEMVTVSPGQGKEVHITVKRAGQSSVQVTSQQISKQLSIMAWYRDDTLQVEVTEKP